MSTNRRMNLISLLAGGLMLTADPVMAYPAPEPDAFSAANTAAIRKQDWADNSRNLRAN